MEWAARTGLEDAAAQFNAVLTLVADVLLLAILALAALVVWVVIRDVRRARAFIHPLDVPKDLAEQGFTPEAMARRLAAEITSLAQREPLAHAGEERFELSASQSVFAGLS